MIEKFWGKISGKGNVQMKFDLAAEDVAVELQKIYPLPEPPKTIKYDFEDLQNKVFELKGDGGFTCKKFPVYLKPDKEYGISFRIKKATQASKRPSDNYLIVGQYDKARKFHIIASFAARVPCDGQWHEIKQKFHSPATINGCSIYVYNKNTKASIWLDDLIVAEQ